MKKFNDKISQSILKILRNDGRISWQELGRQVHLSGQATAERVKQMQQWGIIEGFTIKEKRPRHFITMKMHTLRFDEFEQILRKNANVESVDKVSGDSCYHIVFISENLEELEVFLNELLLYGRYRLQSSIRRVK